MKTADRLLAGPFGPPFNQRRYLEHAAAWREMASSLKTVLPDVPHLLADNVSRYVHAGSIDRSTALEDFPSLAPPWPVFWIEYVSRSGRQRRGVLVRDVTGLPNTQDGAGPAAVDDAREKGYDGEVRWVVEWTLFVENQRKQVLGPLGWVYLALDPRGRCVGNRWVIGIPNDGSPAGDRYRSDPDERRHLGRAMRAITDTSSDGAAAEAIIDDERLVAGLLAAYQTVAFLHCRNVETESVDVPPKLDKRHRKDHGRPLLRFQTVRLDVPRKGSTRRPSTGSGGEPPALHIVPGNFHHYGDCCPGSHPAHGLLFGKLEGIYWVPTHARGNPTKGEVRSDFDLQVREGS